MAFLGDVTARADFEFGVINFGPLMCVYAKWEQVMDEFEVSHFVFGRSTLKEASSCCSPSTPAQL
jgi:uncharacterized cupin superfamily protein